MPNRSRAVRPLLVAVLAILAVLTAACGADTAPQATADPTAPDAAAPTAGAPTGATATPVEPDGPLTVYSGRSEELVGPLLEQFTEATGIEVEVRYGDTAELAATILTEDANSPADVFFAQDAGALGALKSEGMLAELPAEHLQQVEPRFRATDDTWVGVSGRARVLVYNTEALTEADVPDSVLDLTGEEWAGKVGWAPTNGSFQAFVTAMRVELGEDATRDWLEGMIDNGVQVYEKNTAIVEAVGRGEIEIGLVNHYYLYQMLAENPSLPAANAFLPGGDVGALVNVAGVGVVTSTDQPEAAAEFVGFLLSQQAQEYFAAETFEYPLVAGVPADDRLPELATLATPDVDLSDLESLEATLELLRSTGALQ